MWPQIPALSIRVTWLSPPSISESPFPLSVPLPLLICKTMSQQVAGPPSGSKRARPDKMQPSDCRSKEAKSKITDDISALLPRGLKLLGFTCRDCLERPLFPSLHALHTHCGRALKKEPRQHVLYDPPPNCPRDKFTGNRMAVTVENTHLDLNLNGQPSSEHNWKYFSISIGKRKELSVELFEQPLGPALGGLEGAEERQQEGGGEADSEGRLQPEEGRGGQQQQEPFQPLPGLEQQQQLQVLLWTAFAPHSTCGT